MKNWFTSTLIYHPIAKLLLTHSFSRAIKLCHKFWMNKKQKKISYEILMFQTIWIFRKIAQIKLVNNKFTEHVIIVWWEKLILLINMRLYYQRGHMSMPKYLKTSIVILSGRKCILLKIILRLINPIWLYIM